MYSPDLDEQRTAVTASKHGKNRQMSDSDPPWMSDGKLRATMNNLHGAASKLYALSPFHVSLH